MTPDSFRSFRSCGCIAAFAAFAALVLGIGSGAAQQDLPDAGEGAVTSGPARGAALTEARCFATHGIHAGQEFDAAGEMGTAPCALLFVHELTRNTAPVIRALDELASDHAVLGFRSYTIALSGDRTEGEDLLRRVNGSLQLANPIVLSIDGAEGPGNYGLSRKPALTLVLAKGGVVERSVALTDTGPNDVPRIGEWIGEVAGRLPEDGADLRELVMQRLPEDPAALRALAADQAVELHRLRARLRQRDQQQGRGGMEPQRAMRRGEEQPDRQVREAGSTGEEEARPAVPAVKREGGPPDDDRLQTHLRAFIRKTNSDGKCDDVFAEIKARAAESDDLHRQTVEMFKLMLSFRDRYGTAYAQELAENFLKAEKADGNAEPGRR